MKSSVTLMLMPSRRQGLDRRDAFPGGGHLHHQVVARDHLVEAAGLGQRLVRVEGEVGRDLQADIAVGAVGSVVDRAQHVGGGLDVGHRAALVEVDDAGIALVHHGFQGVVVLRRAADGLLEDRGVRGHAAQAVRVHQRLELALGHEAPGDEIEPHGLTLFGEESLERVHGKLLVVRHRDAAHHRQHRLIRHRSTSSIMRLSSPLRGRGTALWVKPERLLPTSCAGRSGRGRRRAPSRE